MTAFFNISMNYTFSKCIKSALNKFMDTTILRQHLVFIGIDNLKWRSQINDFIFNKSSTE